MSELDWYPADWVDESCPPARPSPDGFIVPVTGGFELGYADPQMCELHNQPLKPGDVIEFVSCDRLGDVEATLRADGSYQLHGGVIPPSHNVVLVDGDIDTLQGSFDELIAAIKSPDDPDFSVREMIFHQGETEKRVTLQFADWSDPKPFLFEVNNGVAAFSPVPAQKN